MFERRFHIGSNDVDPHFELKISSLFRFLQEAATEHAEVIGVGKDVTFKKGMFWVISRYSVSIFDIPKYLDDIVVKTYPGKALKFIYPRYFRIETLDGKLLAQASSTWALLEEKEHKIVTNPFPGFVFPSEHLDDEEKLPKRISEEGKELISNRKVLYSDLDLNRHLNNSKYIEYIIDIHNLSFYDNHKIKHIDINFDHEIKDGDEVKLFVTSNQGSEIVTGKVDDQNMFNAFIEYR